MIAPAARRRRLTVECTLEEGLALRCALRDAICVERDGLPLDEDVPRYLERLERLLMRVETGLTYATRRSA